MGTVLLPRPSAPLSSISELLSHIASFSTLCQV